MTHEQYRVRKARRAVSRARALSAILPPLLLLCIPGALLIYSGALGCILGAPLLLLGVADTRGRYKDFRYLDKFGYINQRIADYYGQSFCGRCVVVAVDPDWAFYYKTRGYRIYHIFPAGFPTVMLRPAFWRNLAGGHRR